MRPTLRVWCRSDVLGATVGTTTMAQGAFPVERGAISLPGMLVRSAIVGIRGATSIVARLTKISLQSLKLWQKYRYRSEQGCVELMWPITLFERIVQRDQCVMVAGSNKRETLLKLPILHKDPHQGRRILLAKAPRAETRT
jgi:hypothetical protein